VQHAAMMVASLPSRLQWNIAYSDNDSAHERSCGWTSNTHGIIYKCSLTYLLNMQVLCEMTSPMNNELLYEFHVTLS